MLLSAALTLHASDQQTESEKKKQTAIRAIYAQLVTPIIPLETRRSFMSRRIALPAMHYETEVLGEDSEAPGEFNFRIRERHRVAGKKPHPRDGLIVHTGYYESQTGNVHVFDRQSGKLVRAADHPKVIKGRESEAQYNRNQLRELGKLKSKSGNSRD